MGKQHLSPPVSGQKKRQSYWKKIGDFKQNYSFAAKRTAYTTGGASFLSWNDF